jgi:predicted Zn finger-like uncharacterized protein
MSEGRPPRFVSFSCPNCKARYQVVKVEAGPETVFDEVPCLVCGLARFPGRDGEFVVKYFLFRHVGRRRLRRQVHDLDSA